MKRLFIRLLASALYGNQQKKKLNFVNGKLVQSTQDFARIIHLVQKCSQIFYLKKKQAILYDILLDFVGENIVVEKVFHFLSPNKISSASHDTNKTDMPRLLNSNRFRIQNSSSYSILCFLFSLFFCCKGSS